MDETQQSVVPRRTLSTSPGADFSVVAVECVRLVAGRPDAVLLIPTETVYGLACAWGSVGGRAKIRQAKRREPDKPLQMLAGSVEMARRHGAILAGVAERIAMKFFPGPLTLVVPSSDGGTIGFRIPDHAFVLDLLRRLDAPLAATSANLAGEPPALSVDDALAKLDAAPDLAVDAGPLPATSIASTVVKADAEGFEILRPGPITSDAIHHSLRQ